MKEIEYIQGEHVFVCDHNNFWTHGNYISFDENAGKHLVKVGKEKWLVNSTHLSPKNTYRKKEVKNDKKERDERREFDREGY